MSEIYFIGGSWDGRREQTDICGDYYEVREMPYSYNLEVCEPTPVKHYFYTRHWKFKDVFVCHGEESPGMVKIQSDVVMNALGMFYNSEFLYALRVSVSPVLNAKAEQLMKEADAWYKQARHSDGWVYCGEKLLALVQEYGEIEL